MVSESEGAELGSRLAELPIPYRGKRRLPNNDDAKKAGELTFPQHIADWPSHNIGNPEKSVLPTRGSEGLIRPVDLPITGPFHTF